MTELLTLTRTLWDLDPAIPIFCGLAALIAVGVLVQLLRLGVLAYGRVLGNRRRRRLIIQRMDACAYRDPGGPRVASSSFRSQTRRDPARRTQTVAYDGEYANTTRLSRPRGDAA